MLISQIFISIHTKNNSMNYEYDMNYGVYKVQAGFKSTTALIICPYIPHKIQVEDAHLLRILDASEVYWTELKRFVVNKRSASKQQTIILAQIVGIKHCKYISEGTNILCSIYNQPSNTEISRIAYALPISNKLPAIQIQGINLDEGLIGKGQEGAGEFYYWAQITHWNYNQQYPCGVITGKFKKAKTAESEAEAVLYSMEINQNQHQPIKVQKLSYLPIKDHKNFEEIIFTIDPKECDDMEDALSLKILDNSKKIYEVGVHISDVSSYMHLVNRHQICEKACTIYLPHKKIPLFPQEIIEICRFKAKAQRLSFSIFITMDHDGQILSSRVERLVVQNTAALNYQQAQNILDSQDKQSSIATLMDDHQLKYKEASRIIENLQILRQIASCRRKIRKGQQILDRKQVTFQLDQNKMPIQIGIRKRYESQRLIQEFMIAANGQVAKKLVNEYGPNALVITHPRPTQYSINNFNSFLSDYGVKFNSENILSLQSQMKKLFETQGIKDEFKEVMLMRARQMQELATYTKYMNSEKGHYGLNMEYYTHFTSPLRRFADVIVHQQLTSCLLRSNQQYRGHVLGEEIQILNRMRVKSKKLKQYIVECFLNLFLHEKKSKLEAKALIMSLGKRSVTLYIPVYNLVKEVFWKVPVELGNRNSVKVQYQRNCQLKTLHKDDSIDIEIEAAIHQQVSISMFIKDEDKKYEI